MSETLSLDLWMSQIELTSSGDWPLPEGDGGCTECWEEHCSQAWWSLLGVTKQQSQKD